MHNLCICQLTYKLSSKSKQAERSYKLQTRMCIFNVVSDCRCVLQSPRLSLVMWGTRLLPNFILTQEATLWSNIWYRIFVCPKLFLNSCSFPTTALPIFSLFLLKKNLFFFQKFQQHTYYLIRLYSKTKREG